jgi:2-oxo-3-hexenedioate decarboxylase
MNGEWVNACADALIGAQDRVEALAPFSDARPDFDVGMGYEVLHEIHTRRIAQGNRPVGRKIGFTNRTIWPRYGVFQPMWAHVWATSVQDAKNDDAVLALDRFMLPRIEPEVVFRLRGPIPLSGNAREILRHVEWIASGFEIVQSHFPDWKFRAADCTAAFGLHAALVVGKPVLVTDANRDRLAEALPTFAATLRKGNAVIDRGVGANVLDSPALALVHLARTLAAQPFAAPLTAGEIVTTGTVTDAWPVAAGETWTSDYGELGIDGLRLQFR